MWKRDKPFLCVVAVRWRLWIKGALKLFSMSRNLKNKVVELLKEGDRGGFDRLLAETVRPVRLVSPLVSSFYSPDLSFRWEAVLAFGKVADALVKREPESGRIVMRRLMWSLNDESGGIGWGAPEAMAEAMARNILLAEEYCRILLSYIREDGNYLEYLPLRRGALWGLMRFARFRQGLFDEIQAVTWLIPYFYDKDPESRALAALAAGYSSDKKIVTRLETLLDDNTPILIFINEKLQDMTPAKAAAMAVSMLQ